MLKSPLPPTFLFLDSELMVVGFLSVVLTVVCVSVSLLVLYLSPLFKALVSFSGVRPLTHFLFRSRQWNYMNVNKNLDHLIIAGSKGSNLPLVRHMVGNALHSMLSAEDQQLIFKKQNISV